MDSIIINRPKKQDNNTYCANIYNKEPKNLLKIDLQDACIVSIKHTSEEGTYLFIRCKHMSDIFYDVNESIINTVNSNCEKWFNHAIDPNIIEEYYSNTLVYDKQHQILVRLKCISIPDNTNDFLNKKSNIKLILKNLRFFKQKYVLEWIIEDISISATDIETYESDNEGDLPEPDHEALEQLRSEYVTNCTNTIESILKDKDALEKRLQMLQDVHTKLHKETDQKKVIALYDSVEKILDHN